VGLGTMAAAIIAANMRAHREREGEKARRVVVDQVFEKYDTDRSGTMEEDELSEVLMRMNNGVAPVRCTKTTWDDGCFFGAGGVMQPSGMRRHARGLTGLPGLSALTFDVCCGGGDSRATRWRGWSPRPHAPCRLSPAPKG
jgi:hypothetical protein